VCAGPVVPTAPGLARDDGEIASLVAAQRAGGIRLGWIAITFVLGAIASMAVGLALLVGLAVHTASAVLAALAFAATVLAVLSWRRARRAGAEARAKLDDAWVHVAEEVMRARDSEITAKDLATAMQTDVARAEELLSRLSATGRTRVEVREEDAELAHQLAEDDPAQAQAQAQAQQKRVQ
jgi:hypothetical protein